MVPMDRTTEDTKQVSNFDAEHVRICYILHLLKGLGSMLADVEWTQVLKYHVVDKWVLVAQESIRIGHHQLLESRKGGME